VPSSVSTSCVSSVCSPGEPVGIYPGEIPALIGQAFAVAQQHGLTITALADELRVTLPRLRLLLGQADQRPNLQLVQ
jgi:hypothetical protein